MFTKHHNQEFVGGLGTVPRTRVLSLCTRWRVGSASGDGRFKISLSLKQTETKHEFLHPLNIVVPADEHKTEEWRPNMAAQVPSPKQFPSFKNKTKSEPGTKCFA